MSAIGHKLSANARQVREHTSPFSAENRFIAAIYQLSSLNHQLISDVVLGVPPGTS